MKMFKVLLIITFLSFVGLSCKSDGSDNSGKGGPDVSPEDYSIDEVIPDDTGDLTDDVDNSDTVDDISIGDDEAEDLADGDVSDDTGDSEDESEDEIKEAVIDDGETEDSEDVPVESPGRIVTLDTSNGRWFKVPEKNLLDKDLFDKYMSQIKDYSVKIKDLESQIKQKKADEDSIDSEKIDEDSINAQIKEYREKIRELRGKIGYSNEQEGLYTAYANQNLYLRIRDNSKPGWYKLLVVAKNIHGPLPGFYSHFNISVRNESTDRELGGIFVKASDTVYNRGRMLVYLDEGDTDLNLIWTNDAYKEGKYDANIQIKRVSIKFNSVTGPKRGLTRLAHQYSYIDGRWFWDHNSARTYWADQTIGFGFPELKAGKYKIIFIAKNYGAVPPNYGNFIVEVDTNDGISGQLLIPADQSKFRRGDTVLDLTGGDTTIYLTWTNDAYKEGEYDANIQIKRLLLKRIGESERSALAAYLIAKASSNKRFVVGMLFIISIVLGGIFMWNKRRLRTA